MSTQGHEQEAVNVQDLKAAFQKFKTDKIDNGEAPGFVAGNVVGEFSDTGAEFAYRPTAGAVDIESGKADFGGHLEKIKGNTVPFNQLIRGEFVDMGLPSGTLWAKTNIDVTQANGFAASEFQYDCSFFSWGNTDGHNPVSTSAFDYNFNQSNYDNTPGAALTSNITYINDASRKNDGAPWRMPTETQFTELFNNCVFIDANGDNIPDSTTNKMITLNGVVGIWLKSNINGNTLFFACSGHGSQTSQENMGVDGSYWSNSLNSSELGGGLYFYNSGVNFQSRHSRYYGIPIRPVLSSGIFTDGDGHKYYVRTADKTAYDLTLIYGAGNEPTTVAAFEADYQKWFGKPLSYEDYDAGSLRPVKMTGIKTVGFNLWDEEWVNGFLNLQQGGDYVYDPSVICSKNYFPILPNKNYNINQPNGKVGAIVFYDVNYAMVGYVVYVHEFTTPSNAAFCKFDMLAIYGSTYNHDICINLHHSGDRDGEYEPYWESTLNVPITTLKGKLNGQGGSVVVFPDGMKKAGSVYDEIVRRGDKTYAIKRVGSVDLGTLNYVQDTSREKFSVMSSTIDILAKSSIWNTNVLCGLYSSESGVDLDKTICGFTSSIMVCDTSYSDITAFIAAMSGIVLFYELATPEEYLLDDFELPQDYDVDDWGTEEVLLGENGCAPVLDLKYGINAGDTIKNLPHNYVSINRQNFSEGQQAIARQNIGAASEEDMIRVKKQLEVIIPNVDNDYFVDMGLPSGILWAKRNVDISQPDGFVASEYQYEGSFFSWGNTDGHNPISESAFDYDFGSANSGPYANTEGAKLTGNITLSFDAARANVGTPWRMPTTEEFAELFNSEYTKFIDANGDDIAAGTTDKRVTMNGIVGIRLKSKVNGDILFFPCSGAGSGTSWVDSGSSGLYWSASFYSDTYGCDLAFYSGGVYSSNTEYRYFGIPVRPVM